MESARWGISKYLNQGWMGHQDEGVAPLFRSFECGGGGGVWYLLWIYLEQTSRTMVDDDGCMWVILYVCKCTQEEMARQVKKGSGMEEQKQLGRSSLGGRQASYMYSGSSLFHLTSLSFSLTHSPSFSTDTDTVTPGRTPSTDHKRTLTPESDHQVDY